MTESRVLALKMNDTNKLPEAAEDKDLQAQALPLKTSDKEPCTSAPLSNTDGGDKENIVTEADTDAVDIDDKSLEIDESAKALKDPIKRKKIAGYIAEKSLRVRSYVRRRPIPLKRVHEIDVQCGTKSFFLQICQDFEEAVYCGNSDLVKCFLGEAGLKISDVNQILVAGKYQARPRGTSHNWEHDYNPAPASDDGDEDFFDTIKNKKEKEKETKSEAAKKTVDVEFIKNPIERFKKFKAFKEGLFSKVKEIDNICGVTTFVIIINMERDAAFYYGADTLVSDFFTAGLSRTAMLKQLNVRRFDLEEVDSNVCCVPQCAVTRNTLSRWRTAAIQNFRFPEEISFNLHLCPSEDRDKWIAEIDLDPAFKTRNVAVCSLHFLDGYPTPENPHPTQLLVESSTQQFFQGKVPEPAADNLSPAEAIQMFCQSLLENIVLRNVNKQIDLVEERREKEEKRRKEREEKKKKDLMVLRSVRFHKFTPLVKMTKRKLKRLKQSTLRTVDSFKLVNKKTKLLCKKTTKIIFTSSINKMSSLHCRFCSSKFVYTKALIQHIRSQHIAPVRKRELKQLEISNVERRRVMSRLYPPPKSRLLDAKKKYVCAVCKSVCDLIGLFDHMKEVHHGLLCQFCLKLFKKVRDLQHHLKVSHGEQPRYYHTMDQFKQYSGSNYSLACGDCSVVMGIEEAEHHTCSARVTLDCPWCRQVMLTQEEVEGHIVNGCCHVLKLFDTPPSFRDVQVVYKILTGNNLEMPEEEETNPADMMDTEINSLLEVDIGGTTINAIKVVKDPLPQKKLGFTCFYKTPINSQPPTKETKPPYTPKVLLEDIPLSGTIFSGSKSKGITNNIKKEFKDKGRSYDISKELAENNGDLNLDDSVKSLVIQKAGKNFIIEVLKSKQLDRAETESEDNEVEKASTPSRLSKRIARQPIERTPEVVQTLTPIDKTLAKKEKTKPESRLERITRFDFEIKENLKKMRRIIDTYPDCLFCQQCKTVSVDAQFLLSHFHIIHSDSDINNIMGENAQHCIARIKRYLRDIKKKEILFNYIPPEEIFILEFYRCSYCPTSECRVYDDLFKHTADAHQTKVLTCNICHNIFLNYGSLISHVCSGPPTSSTARARFACKVCHRIDLSSFLDFQTHIRREHNTCEICFQLEEDQTSLHAHCATHDQDLMCMKCFVTFEKPESFRKHMFWKHSHEQSDCQICHSPTWPHVYHFCLPNLPVPCHTCDQTLPNSASFKVHNRQHLGTTPHVCNESKCDKSFISKSLLWKHQVRRHPQLKDSAGLLLYTRKLRKDAVKFGTDNTEALDVAYKVIEDLWEGISQEIEKRKPAAEAETSESLEKLPEKKDSVSVLDAAIRSIMPESEEEAKPNDARVDALPNSDRDAIQATIAERSYSEDNSWQAGLDALLVGASVKLPKVPAPSDLPPDQLFQNTDNDEAGAKKSSDEDDQAPVIGGLWNQDLCFIGRNQGQSGESTPPSSDRQRFSTDTPRGGKVRGSFSSPYRSSQGGPRLRGMGSRSKVSQGGRTKSIDTKFSAEGAKTNSPSAAKAQFDLNLSESSDEGSGSRVVRPAVSKKLGSKATRPLLDHDYCYAAFLMSQEPIQDTNEMDKIVSNVAFDGFGEGYDQTYVPLNSLQKSKRRKKKKDKKKKKKKKKDGDGSDSSDSSDVEVERKVDMFGIKARNLVHTPATPAPPTSTKKSIKIKSPQVPLSTPLMKRGPKPKYHTPDVAKTAGVTAGTARPSFDTDSSSHGESDIDLSKVDLGDISDDEIRSSDLDTDFSADEGKVTHEPPQRSTSKSASKPTLKLKIKLPPPHKDRKATPKPSKSKKRRRSNYDISQDEKDAKPLSKKMRESLALNQRPASSDEDQCEESYGDEEEEEGEVTTGQAELGAKSEESLKLYCYCQCPHDDISEMIGCDAPDCRLEWFHFECVGIMVPPEGKWYCPECTKRYGLE